MEAALRRYNGKPLINSVNGKEESLAAILPLVKKYGGGLVCLTLDDDGIPADAEGRLAIAEKSSAGPRPWASPAGAAIDGLTMPVSAGGENAKVTLETLRRAKAELGVKTALGVSNVSFGLPKREVLNQNFFTMALQAGLDGAIINPKSGAMLGAYHAYRALMGLDEQCGPTWPPSRKGAPWRGRRPQPPRPPPRRPPSRPRPGGRGGGHPPAQRVQGPQGGRRRPGQGPGGGRPGHSGHHQRGAGPRPGPGGEGL